MFKDNLAKNIKTLRARHNLTQAELAEKLGITRQTLSSYENATREPDITILIEMANHFDCSVDFLIFDNIKNNIDDIYENFKIGEFKEFDNQLEKYMISKRDQLETVIKNLNFEIEKINSVINLINNTKKTIDTSIEEDTHEKINIPLLKRNFNCLVKNIKFDSFITTILKAPLSSSKKNNYFIVTMQDDSMNKLFNNNEKLIIEKTNKLENGDIGFLLINDSEFTIKEIHYLNNNYIRLSPISTNKDYEEEIYDLNKVNIKVQGKYIINLDDYL